MTNRMSEWDVQRAANNLDRINDYRRTKGNDMSSLDASKLSERMTEWEIQTAANNLDRINDYRRRPKSLKESLFELAFYIIFFAIFILVYIFMEYPEIGVAVIGGIIVLGLIISISAARNNGGTD